MNQEPYPLKSYFERNIINFATLLIIRVRRINTIIISTLWLSLILSSCTFWDNFTTFFNTYYNQDRLMFEIEDEFEYISEKKRVTPRVVVPEAEINLPYETKTGPPPFMKEYIKSQQELQPVNAKLDSIEIKGSKILAYHPKSRYVENTLFLMAKGYFYENAWLPSQIKCSELIDKFPDGDKSPDAHLLMSENYLIQRKFIEGRTLLSRTVDIAWQKERYDILSEAFRFEAELSLYEGDFEGAIKPYKQAIAQSGDNTMKARWQVDLASLYYRAGKFEKALHEFVKVKYYSPDYLAEFESQLYQAACLVRLERFKEAEDILDRLERDGNNEDWLAYIFAERINILKAQKNTKDLPKAEKFADSAFMSNPAIMASYFEIGMEHFYNKNYTEARKYFARSKTTRSPVFEHSQRMYYLLNQWDEKKSKTSVDLQRYEYKETFTDSAASVFSRTLFDLGRIHEQLGNADSAHNCYKIAVDVCPNNDKEKARYIFAYSRIVKDSDPYLSDSLMILIAEKYPFTDYGKDAIEKMGFTQDFVIDTLAELYNSGYKLMKFGEFSFAISQFTKIYTHYPKSDLAPKSIYTIGWLYERKINNFDSALYYYQMLINDYPYSIYANDVRLSVAYLLALRTGQELPDSLKLKIAELPKKGESVQPDNKMKIKNDKENIKKITPDNIIDAPENLIKGAKELINNPLDALKQIEIPKSPLDLIKPSEKKEQKPDSTESENEEPD